MARRAPENELVCTVRVGGTRLHVTGHAANRIPERLWPGLTLDAAIAQFTSMAHSIGTVSDDRPAWKQPNERDRRPCRWLYLGDDIAFPIIRDKGKLVIVTCLTRGELAPEARDHRNKIRRSRAASRRTRARHRLHGNGRDRDPQE